MLLHASIFAVLTLGVLSTTAAKNPKRGLAFAEGDNPGDINKANQSNSVISWQYDWGTSPPSYLATSGIPYVPMQWGAGGIADFAASVHSQGANVILGFNEPDLASQSNIDPTEAAQLWQQYIQPLHSSGIRLVAPAVTNGPSGLPWMSDFLAACTGCTIDAIGIHWYGSGIGNFYDYLWQAHYEFPSYPLWITEFAETSTDDAVVLDFLNQTIIYMDSLDWIERYAWFAYFRQETGSYYNLLDANGNLNALGTIYVET